MTGNGYHQQLQDFVGVFDQWGLEQQAEPVVKLTHLSLQLLGTATLELDLKIHEPNVTSK